MTLKDFKTIGEYVDYLCVVEDWDEDSARDQAEYEYRNK